MLARGSLCPGLGRMPVQVPFLIPVPHWIFPGLLGLHYHSLPFRDEAAEIQRGEVVYFRLYSTYRGRTQPVLLTLTVVICCLSPQGLGVDCGT